MGAYRELCYGLLKFDPKQLKKPVGKKKAAKRRGNMTERPPEGDSWETDSRYSGMTVNERIFEAGLMDEWDSATARRDRIALRAILETVSLTPAAAEDIADAHLQRTS